MSKCSALITPTPMPPSITWQDFYQRQGRYAEAEPFFQRALAIYEQALPHTLLSQGTTSSFLYSYVWLHFGTYSFYFTERHTL